MDYAVKHLGSADVGLFKKLLAVFGEAFGEIDTYQKAVPSDQYLTSLLGKEHIIVLVAIDNGIIIGGLVAYELEKFEQERKEIYIYDLAVAENFRRQGIATKLINELKIIAKEQGAYVIYVQADKEDMPAIQLYKSLGVQEDVYHFDITVD